MAPILPKDKTSGTCRPFATICSLLLSATRPAILIGCLSYLEPTFWYRVFGTWSIYMNLRLQLPVEHTICSIWTGLDAIYYASQHFNGVLALTKCTCCMLFSDWYGIFPEVFTKVRLRTRRIYLKREPLLYILTGQLGPHWMRLYGDKMRFDCTAVTVIDR